MDFNYYLPVNIFFGRGKIGLLGEKTATYGKNALIVTGRTSTKKTGLLDKAIKLLEKSNIQVTVFDEVEPNPLTKTAIDGANIAKEKEIDVIVALGGGSVLDCAKGIAFITKNDGDINDYIFARKQSDEALPIIAVTTTCGTGSEGNGFAVLTNEETGDKKSLRCSAIVPKVSILDSTLMETMPKSVLASVGFDAFCHNMEAYLAKNAQPFTDMMAKVGMELIHKSLLKIYNGTGSGEDWDNVALASLLGGMVINTAGVTVAHGLEHPASGFYNLVHGKGLSALTPVIMKRTVHKAKEKCTVISKCLGGTDYTDCVEKIENLISSLNLNETLGEQGVPTDSIDKMYENYMKVSISSHNNFAVLFTEEEIKEIYKESL